MYESIFLMIGALLWGALFIAYNNPKLKILNVIFFILMLGFIEFAIISNNNGVTTTGTNSIIPIIQSVKTTPSYINETTSYTYYYLNSTNSNYNISDLYYSLSKNFVSAPSQLTSVVPAIKGHFKLFQFITPANVPELTQLSRGLYQFHLHVYTNDSFGSLQLYTQLWAIAPDDNNTFMVAQTGLTQYLQPNETEYINNVYVNQTTMIPAHDRLALFVFANNTDAFGQSLNVTLFMGGLDNAHISIPTINTKIINGSTIYTYINETNTTISTTSSPNNPITALNDAFILIIFIFGAIGARVGYMMLKGAWKD